MKERRLIRKSTLNYAIDDLLHPSIADHPELKILDLMLHFIVESDPEESVLKALEYELPEVAKQLRRRNARRRPGR